MKYVERISKFAKKYLAVWLIGQFVSLYVAAQYLPLDILDRLPLLNEMCNSMAARLPNISTYVSRSAFPQVAMLIICLGWLIAPINAVFFPLAFSPVTLEQFAASGKRIGRTPAELRRGMVLAVILLPLIVWAFAFTQMLAPDIPASSTEYSHNSRIAFGFVGQAMSNWMGMLAGAWFFLVVRVLPAYSKNRSLP